MGIKERHEREREHVRRAILDAARELFVADGFSNVSIRKIADRIEYSPAAIYGYFPSKDDIFFALAEEGFEIMHDAVGDDSQAPSPLEALRRRMRALYRFSVEHPEYFVLLFLDRSVPRIRDAYDRFDRLVALKHSMAALVERAMAVGELPGGRDPRALVHLMVPPVMGVAAMRIFSRLPDTPHIEHLARDVIETMLAGLAAGLPVTFDPGPALCESTVPPEAARPSAGPDEHAGDTSPSTV
ncbi:MAG: TetR/AcrR family transcriptional regulator [Vicinamibacteraceae bacterium]|nr:TetR/AcrR family transcriptional regulator [Vicinamibacteraceae bacterium]